MSFRTAHFGNRWAHINSSSALGRSEYIIAASTLPVEVALLQDRSYNGLEGYRGSSRSCRGVLMEPVLVATNGVPTIITLLTHLRGALCESALHRLMQSLADLAFLANGRN